MTAARDSLTPDSLTDADLVALHLGGDARAFAALVRRHKAPVYRLIAARLRDGETALDLTQETFVSAHGALARFDPARSLRAWLAAIALNKCRDHARRRWVRGWLARALPIDVAATVADPAIGIEDAAIDRDRLARTLAAVGRLPAQLAEPLLLCSVEALSQAEAAEALGISAKAVETRIRRARAALAADPELA